MNIIRRLSFLLAVLLLCVGLFPARVQADSIRVTKGDVEAILNAFTTGGLTILRNTNEVAGYHSGFIDYKEWYGKGSIRPYFGEKQYCVSDWHVILLGVFIGGGQWFSYQDASSHLSQVELAFKLDNELLLTTQTSIKRFLEADQYGMEEAYGFQEGAIMAPGELGIGEHLLEIHVYEPEFYGLPEIDHTFVVSFFVGDDTSPACN